MYRLVRNKETESKHALGELVVLVEVLRGRNLVAKDRNLFGKKTTSDPYVVVYHHQRDGKTNGNNKKEIGRTQILSKQLDPVWNAKFEFVVDADDRTLINGLELLLVLFDHDKLSDHDSMGTVTVQVDPLETVTSGWYKVQCGKPSDGSFYCRNASGEIELACSVSARCKPQLQRGHSIPVRPWTSTTIPSRLTIGCLLPHEQASSVMTACVAIDRKGKYVWEETLFFARHQNPTKSIHYARDNNPCKNGYQESFDISPQSLPSGSIAAYYFVMSATSPFISSQHLSTVSARWLSLANTTAQYEFRPQSIQADTTTVILAALVHDHQRHWRLCWLDDSYAGVRDFGALIPELRGYTRPLLLVDSDDTNNGSSNTNKHCDEQNNPQRTAIVRHGGCIRISDYSVESKTPDRVTVGIAWTIDPNFDTQMDLDVSAICLSEDLEEMEIISFRQLVSQDRSIQHGKDARNDNVNSSDDDEQLHFRLPQVSPAVYYIGIVLNSYSNHPLLHVCDVSCRLYDSSKNDPRSNVGRGPILLHYPLSNPEQLQDNTALVVGSFCRCPSSGESNGGSDDWIFRIFSEPAEGHVVHENVDELQDILRGNVTGLEQTISIPSAAGATIIPEGLPDSRPLPNVLPEEEKVIPSFHFSKELWTEDDVDLS